MKASHQLRHLLEAKKIRCTRTTLFTVDRWSCRDLDDNSETSSRVIFEIEEEESNNQQLDDDWSESLNSLHSRNQG
ncbi:hypothetical protein NPIL_407821 [Nephila pilipes]|uniref:Uncharacterized protein n=1 Tax=Nephila pilipes TaxID=299642 RepID=A0A8X6NP67_NEPPI|nr:hypothetical protein NPIL_407821 [Nephila pilipes]